MLTLYEWLETLLINVHENIWSESIPEDTPMPYGIYRLPNVDIVNFGENFFFEVELFDHSSNPSEIETLWDNVNKALDRQRYYSKEKGLAAKIYRVPGAFQVPEQDPQLKRRMLNYSVKTRRF